MNEPKAKVYRGPWTVKQQRANREIAQFNQRVRAASLELAQQYRAEIEAQA